MFTTRVVGVSFADPDNAKRQRLLVIAQDRQLLNPFADTRQGEGLAVVLVRRPTNPHDPNAIEVHVPAIGDDGMVGHLPRDRAAELAPSLDGGEWAAQAEIMAVYVKDGIANYGIGLRVWAVRRG